MIIENGMKQWQSNVSLNGQYSIWLIFDYVFYGCACVFALTMNHNVPCSRLCVLCSGELKKTNSTFQQRGPLFFTCDRIDMDSNLFCNAFQTDLSTTGKPLAWKMNVD